MLWLALGLGARQRYTLVSYNCENLFDTRYDSLKNDTDFTPDGSRGWSFRRYMRKVNAIGRVVQQAGGNGEDWSLPDIVGLMEVENDSVMLTLTRRGMLKEARYSYIMTQSEDERGIDVALMYNAMRLRLLGHEEITIPKMADHRRTRNILYAAFRTVDDDTLHILTAHLPSRAGHHREEYRLFVVDRLLSKVDSVRSEGTGNVIVMGDFNDYSYNKSVKRITEAGLREASAEARGLVHPDEVCGTYRFKQEWGSLDHIFTSDGIQAEDCFIYDADWMLEKGNDGRLKPYRTYLGNYYHGGVSDHLPLVLRFSVKE